MEEDKTLFEQLGGRPILEKVHKIFYDKVYAHPWLKHYFRDVPQKTIENQQTDFMTANMGGGRIYSGALPVEAHKHIHITGELFDLRERVLRESLSEARVPSDLAERWMRIDNAFRHSLVKSLEKCQKRFFTDEIISVSKPPGV